MVRRRRLLLITGIAVIGGVLHVPAGHTRSCAAPTVSVNNGPVVDRSASATPGGIRIDRRQDLVVTGQGFGSCPDLRPRSACGVGPYDTEPPRSEPSRDVELVLGQRDRVWSLGTSDAAADLTIVWRSVVPAECADGPATVRVGAIMTLSVSITSGA